MANSLNISTVPDALMKSVAKNRQPFLRRLLAENPAMLDLMLPYKTTDTATLGGFLTKDFLRPGDGGTTDRRTVESMEIVGRVGQVVRVEGNVDLTLAQITSLANLYDTYEDSGQIDPSKVPFGDFIMSALLEEAQDNLFTALLAGTGRTAPADATSSKDITTGLRKLTQSLVVADKVPGFVAAADIDPFSSANIGNQVDELLLPIIPSVYKNSKKANVFALMPSTWVTMYNQWLLTTYGTTNVYKEYEQGTIWGTQIKIKGIDCWDGTDFMMVTQKENMGYLYDSENGLNSFFSQYNAEKRKLINNVDFQVGVDVAVPKFIWPMGAGLS